MSRSSATPRFATTFIAPLATALMIVVLLGSCKKDPVGNDPLPPVSDTPSISLKAVTPSTVQHLNDLEFTVMYLDGDGDLGFSEADSQSLFITDNRFPLTESFHVQPLAPIGSNISIQGELVITLENVILKDTANASESATFTVQMKDRAGNWSNEAGSGTVTVTK